MSARLNPRHQDMVRAKIQASNLITRLLSAFEGEIELTAVQVSIAKLLLDKSVPNLQNVVLSGDEDGGPLRIVAAKLDEAL